MLLYYNKTDHRNIGLCLVTFLYAMVWVCNSETPFCVLSALARSKYKENQVFIGVIQITFLQTNTQRYVYVYKLCIYTYNM